MKKIKVLSYNMHKGFSSGNRMWKLPEMRTAINELNADLIFLQEVQGKFQKRKEKKLPEPEIPQTDFLADDGWVDKVYARNAIYGKAHHGNSILCQHKIISWENINVALSKRASRSLLHAIVEFESQEVHVVCVHLGLFKAERKIQLQLLVERIDEHVPIDAPLIIAGDFNDWQKKASEYLEEQLLLKEAHKVFHGEYGKSFPATRPAFPVDRIYFRGLGLRTAKVLNQEPWKGLSDHLPIYAEFVVLA